MENSVLDLSVRIEDLIIRNLLFNESYCRKVIPHLKSEYFRVNSDKLLFESLKEFIVKYNSIPTKESMILTLNDAQSKTVTGSDIKESLEKLLSHEANKSNACDNQWLMEQTEKWCLDQSVYNGLLESIAILENKDGKRTKSAIPGIMQDALKVSFTTEIGHDYITDSLSRFDSYNRIESKIPYDLDMFNKITGGGIAKKTLNIVSAASGVGKSTFLCHIAASSLAQGYNVLYISCEMAEEKVALRIDANLLDYPANDIKKLPKPTFDKMFEKLRNKISGKLIIKEYPTGSANVHHFRLLLDELRLKKNFVPDLVIIDYMNICSSVRFRGGADNTYAYVKAIAEEFRGFAVEYNVPVYTATQLNRAGYDNLNPGMENTSDSMGTVHTCDLMFAIIQDEGMAQKGQYLIKQLKNRDNEKLIHKFMVSVNLGKQKLQNFKDLEEQNPIEQTEEVSSVSKVAGIKKSSKFDDFK